MTEPVVYTDQYFARQDGAAFAVILALLIGGPLALAWTIDYLHPAVVETAAQTLETRIK